MAVKRPSVWHVVSSLMFGGGQRVALDLVDRLRAGSDLDVHLVALGARIDAGFPRLQAHHAHLASYDGRYNRPVSIMRAALSLRRFLRARHIDIIHTHGWDCDVIAGLARVGLPTEQVVHQHILAHWASSPTFTHRIRRSLTQIALCNRRTSWVTVSHAVKQSLQPLRWLPSADIQVVWNGVDIARFRPSVRRNRNAVPVLGVAARLAPMKGLEYLLKAVAQLKHRGVDWQLRIAGEGELHDDLIALSSSLGIAERVALVGHQHEMCRFYESLDVMVLPSVSGEGLPLSILEAMATGLPVVSTFLSGTLSGIPEAVVDGVTGRLVQPRDPEALAHALDPLLRSSRMRKDMGRAGRLRIESDFSCERMLNQVAAIYDDVLRIGRRRFTQQPLAHS